MRTLAKRAYLIEHGEVSARVEDGARVAVLASFMPELVQDKRDSRRHFLEQIERVEALFRSSGQDTAVFMRATMEDYRKVLQDRQFGSIVLAGFGNISAIAVPFDRDEADSRYAYLDWLHASALADHVKLGKLVMLQCNGLPRTFNAPWGVGIMSSHSDIIGAVGQQRYASYDLPTTPVTDEDELGYRQILAQYQRDNYPAEAEGDVQAGRARRIALYLARTGLLSEENWERLRDVRHALDPHEIFARPFPPTPDPIKIPHTGEFDPRNFPQLQ